MLWMTVPTEDFHLFVFNILAPNGITLTMTFDMARDLYRRCSKLFVAAMKHQQETKLLLVDQNFHIIFQNVF